MMNIMYKRALASALVLCAAVVLFTAFLPTANAASDTCECGCGEDYCYCDGDCIIRCPECGEDDEYKLCWECLRCEDCDAEIGVSHCPNCGYCEDCNERLYGVAHCDECNWCEDCGHDKDCDFYDGCDCGCGGYYCGCDDDCIWRCPNCGEDDDDLLCRKCGLCENCSPRCTECYFCEDCGHQFYCDEYHSECANGCGENDKLKLCSECRWCEDCHAKIGISHCPDCGYCETCNALWGVTHCDECDWCENCGHGFDCADYPPECPMCGENDKSKLCPECRWCKDCDGYQHCPDCGWGADCNVYPHCPDCGLCEGCSGFSHCAECNWCEDCGHDLHCRLQHVDYVSDGWYTKPYKNWSEWRNDPSAVPPEDGEGGEHVHELFSLYGDVNGDSRIDWQDAAALIQRNNGADGAINERAADAAGDGGGWLSVLRLMQWLNGKDVTLGDPGI